MADYPSLPLYTDAFIADTTHLDATATGAYLSLLMAAWRSPQCALPQDDDKLARMARCNARTWQRVKVEVLAFWTVCDDGLLRQKRLSKEREYCNTRRISKSKGAATVNEAKRLKSLNQAHAERSAERAQSERTHTHTHKERKDNSHQQPNSSTSLAPPEPAAAKAAADEVCSKPNPINSDRFEEIDAALRKLPGIEKHPVAVNAVIAPIWELVTKFGLDFQTVIVPSMTDQIRKARPGAIRNWKYFVPGIIESSKPLNGHGLTPVNDETFIERMRIGRKLQKWDRKWGPQPGLPGCTVPSQFITPADHGWPILGEI